MKKFKIETDDPAKKSGESRGKQKKVEEGRR